MTNEELKKVIVSDEFYKYRNQFIKSINKGPFLNYVSPEKSPVKFDIKNADLFKAAVEQGYDDAKRTFTGIGAKWGKPLDKNAFFSSLADKLKYVFQNKEDFQKKEDFDNWHKDTCNSFTSALENQYPATYGQAQKVINMAFKYLYCLDGADAEEYKIIFDKCHMPLDSYTIEWIFQELYPHYTFSEKDILLISSDTKNGKKFYKKYTPAWSKLKVPKDENAFLDEDNNYSYELLKNLVNSHLQDISPLKAEFVIWPEIQLELATKEFLSTLKKYNNTDKIKTIIDKILNQ